ncbi:MAG: carbohydrate kinase family protein [Clostridiaceae bacterium]|nr:carbohydrate kinase family protein [Clostridiaceae bacterium]
MFDVSCIGILVADVIAKPVDKIPDKGLLNLISGISLHSGGCAMSAAVDMSILGIKAAILGKVGNDSFGEFLKSVLESNNVDTDGLCVDKKTQTSASVVLSDSQGERTFLHCTGANGTFSKDDINWDVIEKSKVVFVAGTFLMDTFDGAHCASVLKRCKQMGKTTVLDTAWDSKGRWMDVLEQCMPYIDYFLPSIEEAMALSQKQIPEEIAKEFFDKGVSKVAIKLGSKGCYLQDGKNKKPVIVPPYKVQAVDTTGAGDSFCAGFITALVKGMSFTECGYFANAVGAHCVSALGATTGIKPMDDILAFMEAKK